MADESYPENLRPERFPEIMAENLQGEVMPNLEIQRELIEERRNIIRDLEELIRAFDEVRRQREDAEIPKSYLADVDSDLRKVQELLSILSGQKKKIEEEIKGLRQEVDSLKKKYRIPFSNENN